MNNFAVGQIQGVKGRVCDSNPIHIFFVKLSKYLLVVC